MCITLGGGPPGIQVSQLLEALETVLRRRLTGDSPDGLLRQRLRRGRHRPEVYDGLRIPTAWRSRNVGGTQATINIDVDDRGRVRWALQRSKGSGVASQLA